MRSIASGGQLVAPEILYLNHLLTYVRAGLLPGLNNKMLRRFGRELVFYQGLPEFFVVRFSNRFPRAIRVTRATRSRWSIT